MHLQWQIFLELKWVPKLSPIEGGKEVVVAEIWDRAPEVPKDYT